MATAPSLFGANPEDIQQQRNAALNEEAMQYAKMDPFQRATMGIYRGANQLGGAIGGMLGGADPQMQRLQQRQQMLQGMDQSKPQAWLELARKASSMGDYGGAQEAVAKYQALLAADQKARETEANIGAKLSEKSTPEMKNAAAIAAAEVGGVGTPEYTVAYNAALERLTTKVTPDKLDKVGVSEVGNKAVYTIQTPKGIQQVTFETGVDGKQVMKPFVGAMRETATKISVDASQKGESRFIEKLGELDAATLNKALELKATSISNIKAVDRLSALSEEGITTGAFATNRVGAANFLNTLGLLGGKDVATLASSQTYEKDAGALVLSVLGGKLGAGFSDADRSFVVNLIPQLETSPAARRKFLSFMREKNMEIVKEVTAMDVYARQKKGLGGYEPKVPLPASAASATPSRFEGVSDADLDARIKKLQGK